MDVTDPILYWQEEQNKTLFMVTTNDQQRQGIWRLLVAGFISPKCLQALSDCIFYQILRSQAGMKFLLRKNLIINSCVLSDQFAESGEQFKAIGCWAGFIVLESEHRRFD